MNDEERLAKVKEAVSKAVEEDGFLTYDLMHDFLLLQILDRLDTLVYRSEVIIHTMSRTSKKDDV